MSKRKQSAPKTSSASSSASSTALIDSPQPVTPAVAVSRSTSTSKSKSKSQSTTTHSSTTPPGMQFPLPAGVTDQSFTQEYIPPENTLGRIARRVRWAWNIHAVSAMLDPWEIVLLNGMAILVTTAVGYYCINSAVGWFGQP